MENSGGDNFLNAMHGATGSCEGIVPRIEYIYVVLQEVVRQCP